MKHLKIIMLLCLVFLLAMLPACGKDKKEKSTAQEANTTNKADQTKDKYDEVILDGMAKDVLKTMSLEEKIGQLFIVCTDSLDFYAETSMTDEMKKNIEKYQPGGMILFSFNIKNRDQTGAFIHQMQESAKIPMFMAVDEEGGAVARIGNNKNMGTTAFPPMKEVGDSGDISEAYHIGETIAKDISLLGFNVDFAPVADVMTNENNSEIGDRSFGNDPEKVAKMVKAYMTGLQDHNVSATLKHFPGQGSSGEDTHKGFVNMEVSIDELRETDFLPFIEGINAGVDFIMVSHVAASNVTGNDVPASLSKVVVTEILRNELQYENIIITDAMNMKSITKFYDPDEAALKAFKAGNDMILMPDDFIFAVDELEDAVENGDIEAEELDAAVLRILKVKIKRGLIDRNSDYFH